MTKQVSGDQVYVMPEGSQRVIGRDAMRVNIAIGYAVANIVKTTLGPKGMDKMLVSDLGDIVITNDGATILEEMNVDHPAAKLMVEIAKTQDKEVGDGTTTSVVIAGNLLYRAGELLNQNIHPTVVIKGYELASKKAEEVLAKIADPVTPSDKEILNRIALVAMGSKGIGSDDEKKKIAQIISEAVMQVSETKNGKQRVDLDLIKVENKEIVHAGMPKSVKDAKILLLDAALEIEKTEVDAKIEITSPDKMEAFLQQEEKMMKDMVDKIAATKANVVFCQKGIDDLVQHFLAKKGIVAVRRVKKSDMEKLSRATGAQIASTLEDLKESDLGNAGVVEERKVGGEAMVFVEKCKDPKSVTVFVRGGTDHVVSEVERAVVDARGAVSSALQDGKYVVGGGSVEMEIARELHAFAVQIGGREQLAIQAFAEALESIPRALAENAGMDVIDTIVALRNKHKEKDGKAIGVDVLAGKVTDLRSSGIFEPAKVKKQAMVSATETARLILRIDDIISSRGGAKGGPGGMPPGGPGGMGGMDMD
jgi:thermosome